MYASRLHSCRHLITLDLKPVRNELLVAVHVHVGGNASRCQEACRQGVREVVIRGVRLVGDQYALLGADLLVHGQRPSNVCVPVHHDVPRDPEAPIRGHARVGAAGGRRVVNHENRTADDCIFLHGQASPGVHRGLRGARRRPSGRHRKVGVHQTAREPEHSPNLDVISEDGALLHAHTAVDLQRGPFERGCVREVCEVHRAVDRSSLDDVHSIKDGKDASNVGVPRDTRGAPDDGVFLHNDSLWRNHSQRLL